MERKLRLYVQTVTVKSKAEGCSVTVFGTGEGTVEKGIATVTLRGEIGRVVLDALVSSVTYLSEGRVRVTLLADRSEALLFLGEGIATVEFCDSLRGV